MSRPKGSKDKTKRAKKDTYSRKDIKKINKMFESGMTFQEVQDETGWSYSQLKRMKLKPDLTASIMERVINTENKENICGVYAIGFFETGARAKWYIGSSVNINVRIRSHIADLKNNSHRNQTMQELFNNGSIIRPFLFKECAESELISLENALINQYCNGCLVNKWSLPDDMIEFYEKAAKRFDGKYTIVDECWMWNTEKRGYGRAMSVAIDGVKKYLPPHRVSFYMKTKTIPDLVRHTCNNKQCVNPDHLENGSYSDNSKDRYESIEYKEERRKVEKEFEKLWMKHYGDIHKISKETDYGADRCYYYQKILRLKERYPEITEQKYMMLKKKRKESMRSRGPKREILTDKTINGWKCLENWVTDRTHKWECIQCGLIRYTAKNAIVHHPKCKRCKEKQIAKDIFPYADLNKIKQNGILVGKYHFSYEELK